MQVMKVEDMSKLSTQSSVALASAAVGSRSLIFDIEMSVRAGGFFEELSVVVDARVVSLVM